MFVISHRGNISGSNTATHGENHPASICEVLFNKRVSVEIDVWRINKSLYLGHDNPKYKTTNNFLQALEDRRPNSKVNSLFIHCKNFDALKYFATHKSKNFCYFWHENDQYTLTSNGYIWTYPTSTIGNKKNQILVTEVLLDKEAQNKLAGICTDNILNYIKT